MTSKHLALRHSRSLGAAGAVLALLLAGCSGGGSSQSPSGGSTTKADCAAYASYGDLSGKSVTVYSGIVAPEDTAYINSYKPFEDCTGVKVNYTADKSFEQQVLVQAKAGNAPDIAIVPQPGLLKQLVATGKAVAAPQAVATTSTSGGARTGRLTARSTAPSTLRRRVRA